MANTLGIGTTALSALQRAISTTGQNIANVNTDGYSRQSVSLSARPAQDIGAGYLGSGVQVTSIDRAYNQFLANDVQQRTASSGYYSLYANAAERVDSMLGDPSTSITQAMDSFFASAEAVANSPTSLPERQVMLSNAETLVQRFDYIVGRVDDVTKEMNSQIAGAVSEINQLAGGIATLNDEIAKVSGRSSGLPNDLLDQRDALIVQLSSLVDTKTVAQDDGSLNVFIGRGQPLVTGAVAETLATQTDPNLGSTSIVTLSAFVAGSSDVSTFLTGGKLGAALAVTDEVVNPTRRELNLLAVGFAETVNAIQKDGDDLQGVNGTALFTETEGVVKTAASVDDSTANSGNATVTFTVTDAKLLTGDSYRVDYTATGVNLRNLTTDAVTTLTANPQTVDGVRVTYTAQAATGAAGANQGDAFIVDPVFQASRFLEVKIDDPAKIAAASNGGAAGNNSNMLAMIELRDQSLLKGSTATYGEVYNNLLSDVAVRTQRAQASADTETALLGSALDRQSSLQGVNLDEEAANLVRYQQAYQAAAQIVAVANEVFDTLLRATSR
ncbi:flagellar hook-associated protein FlgK [Luminiphilus sp. nBUS_16]|uniref:flagellar hook-associated protein FlgK n=1 Tax=Luminiphilus sp. nBUS_16 TaxID=3395315 RepID=UPI003EBBCFEF